LHTEVFDFNVTLALDCQLLPGVAERMRQLTERPHPMRLLAGLRA